MNTSYEFHAFVADGKKRHPVEVEVSVPFQSDAGDFACRVSCRFLFADDKDIFGVDAEQARCLAIAFVRQLLAGTQLVDGNDQPIKM